MSKIIVTTGSSDGIGAAPASILCMILIARGT
jgi:short-subunit dehydrogenase